MQNMTTRRVVLDEGTPLEYMTRITSANVGDMSSISVNDVIRLDYDYAASNDWVQRFTEPVHIRAANVDASITDVQRKAHVMNELKGLEERMSSVQTAELRALLLKYKDFCAVSLRDLPNLPEGDPDGH
jgi:hypothetical protein